MNEINIQPSSITFTAVPGTLSTGTPSPGIAGSIPAVGGVATCANLLADSPPTLFEEFEIYSFSIAVAASVPSGTNPPTLQVGVQLMVNDRVAAAYTQTPPVVEAAASNWTTQASFISDLQNPIRVGGRDRLGLRLQGLIAGTSGVVGQESMLATVGATFVNPASPTFAGAESKLFYNTVTLPASRRL